VFVKLLIGYIILLPKAHRSSVFTSIILNRIACYLFEIDAKLRPSFYLLNWAFQLRIKRYQMRAFNLVHF